LILYILLNFWFQLQPARLPPLGFPTWVNGFENFIVIPFLAAGNKVYSQIAFWQPEIRYFRKLQKKVHSPGTIIDRKTRRI
jgi:protoheme ferro-lyase